MEVSMGRYQTIMSSVLLSFLLLSAGCANMFSKSSSKPSGGSSVKISGTLQHGTGKIAATTAVADSICAMPIVKGQEAGDWVSLPGAVINPLTGTFSIELQDSIDGAPAEWVLLLLNSKATSNYDKLVGFLSVNEINQSLITFPLSKSKTDSISVGTVTQNGDEEQSDTSIKLDTAVFDLTLSQLAEMAHTGTTLKVMKNELANYDPTGVNKMEIRTTYNLCYERLSAAMNHELTPLEYFDTSKFGYSMQVFPQSNPQFDFTQISSGAQTFEMYPPAPTYLENVVGAHVYTALINPCYSTDTSGNPIIQHDTSGGMSHAVALLGGDSKGLSSIIYSEFKGLSPEGTWLFTKNKNQTQPIRQFDLSLGLPIDTATGKPNIYIPSVNIAVNTADTTITSITIKWYYWDKASNGYLPAADAGILDNNISDLEVTIKSTAADTVFNFGTSSSTQQAVPLTAALNPASGKFKYVLPAVNQKFTVDVLYTSYYQRFDVMLQDIGGLTSF